MRQSKANRYPLGFRARKQKSGTTYYYYEVPKRGDRKEVPLGSDLQVALIQRALMHSSSDSSSFLSIQTLHDLCDFYLAASVPLKPSKIRAENSAAAALIRRFSIANNILLHENVRASHESTYFLWRGQHATIRARREWSLVSAMQKWYATVRASDFGQTLKLTNGM